MAKKKEKAVKQINNFDNVKLIATTINKRYGITLVKTASETPAIRRMLFDSPVLNYIYDGGIPMGSIIEKHGNEHSFKTTEALKILKMFQDYCFNCHSQKALTTKWGLKDGLPVIEDCKCKFCKEPKQTIQLFIDLEGTTDFVFMELFGINPKGVLYTRPENLSQAGVIVKTWIKLDDIGLIVFDSFGALGTKNEIEKAIDEKSMSDNARETNKIIRGILSGMNYNSNRAKEGELCTTLFLINKKYEKISGYGGLKIQGGRHMQHAKRLSTENRVIDKVFNEESGETLGKLVVIENLKNKAGVPHRKGEFFINQNKRDESLGYLETDLKQEYFEFGLQFKLIIKKGSWFEYKEAKAQGKAKMLIEMDFETLKKEVNELL